ncbi:hypothetical protein MSAN_02353900 [Mycena sanguinolenta]|uniref:Uncharacterized protein n=1 Tax=Mycena sanguinolenta TaxID=230812 RepID=A0A8H6X736_9AGAR|nr:hypothetical protein MSAN_02353900 [Mycena sanguinolenta]
MYDPLSASLILGAISLIPYNRYILWTLGLASFILYGIDRQRPPKKLALLEASIDAVGETLELAKATCTMQYVELADIAREFYELRLSVSNLKSRLLETHNVSTWKQFVDSVRHSTEMWQSIRKCGKNAKEIRTSILRIIEAERQRELLEDIQTSREIISSLTRRASAVNRRVASAITSYESM